MVFTNNLLFSMISHPIFHSEIKKSKASDYYTITNIKTIINTS